MLPIHLATSLANKKKCNIRFHDQTNVNLAFDIKVLYPIIISLYI